MISIKASFPVIVTPDLEQQKAFYMTHFGFTTVYFDETFYVHLLHQDTGIQIGFMLPNHPSQPAFLHPVATPEGMVISFEVDDAQAAYRQARDSELDVAMAIKEESFGQTHFMVKDPAGVIIDIVEDHNE